MGDSSPGQHPARNADTQGFLYRLSTPGAWTASRLAGARVRRSNLAPRGRANSTKRASTVDRKSVRRRRCERAVGESRIAADEVEAVDLCRDSCIGRSK